ncbi:MAG: hypothetical protein CM15mP86_06760 [Gammaproteobacteria bacterium]|nr:MAG: hypothetical protein CM15mP86_06760 [Gammaproteobacteria bacterium]
MSYKILIPARLDSTRLPGKPLRDIAGKTLIQRVVEQAKKVQLISFVLLLTLLLSSNIVMK